MVGVTVIEDVCDIVVVRDGDCVIVCVGLVDTNTQTVSDDVVHAAVCISFDRHTLQAVQVAAFVVVLKVEPAIHEVQPVFVVTVQVVERRVPAAQIVQAVLVAAFVVVLKVEPTKQAVHALFVVTAHAVEA